MHPILRFLMLAVISIVLSFVNWLGLPLVGKMSVSICFVAMSPFMILTIVGAWKVQPSRWLQMPTSNLTAIESLTDDDLAGGFLPSASAGGILWRPFLNNLFWNLNSFDAAGSFAADIDEPGRTLPRAMGWSILMVVAGYFLPLLVALGASDAAQEDWVDGYLARAATQIVGPWLGGWTVFSAGISNIALFQAELSADAFQLMGMADRGYIPKFFSTRSRHGTPTYGIILGCIIIVAMGASELTTLIEMLNFNYALALLMEYCSFIKLRIARPNAERPYKIPLNTFFCILALVPTFFFTLLVLSLASYTTYAFVLAANVVGISIYICKQGKLSKTLICRIPFKHNKPYDAVAAGDLNSDSTTASKSERATIRTAEDSSEGDANTINTNNTKPIS
jgi:amino acid transporter